ncbi:multiple epidermal growth factor-like domains protein 11 [Ylistrum balloti]|uniref:multiple epidermal growth factor-like domains protein 11 n=1 Tax=Ylistrum balloti TaxID=509963 RepID=UPI002905EC4F|nr:multiple epidermal growth factor-like domains protein 11 [Ylistrum balloti]
MWMHRDQPGLFTAISESSETSGHVGELEAENITKSVLNDNLDECSSLAKGMDDVVQSQAGRFGGFQIYLSNTTDWRNGDNCHTDTTSTWQSMDLAPSIQSCTGNTIYLTIYVDRRPDKPYSWYSDYAILELCEVEIYGCPLGKFGNNNCDSNCSTTCVNNSCNPDTGRCTSCVNGNYGSFCDKTCPDTCKDGVCDQHTAECEACVNGNYGRFCGNTCPDTCKDGVCDQHTAECEACVNGNYGGFCDRTCPDTCKDGVCDQHTAECEACVQGVYGSVCDQMCTGNCKDNDCIQGNGFCTECEAGYHGTQCDKSCPSKCRDNLCNQTNGLCTECAAEFYGVNCSLICPDHCKDQKCNQKSGQCTECVSGFYGNSCADKCDFCQDGNCDKLTGSCLAPCVDGRTGDRCDVKVIHLTSYEAAIGIGVGCGLIILALIIVIVVQTRRLHSRSNGYTPPRSTTTTNIALSSIEQELRRDTVNLCRKSDIKTSQSSNYSATSTSEKAVDGRTDQKFSSGSCIHTQTEPAVSEAWWQIDFGGPVVIEHVKIYYRNDSYEQSKRFGGFQIYLSNTTDWRNSDNCHTDTTSEMQLMNLAPEIQSCTGNTIYLTIYVDRRPNKPYSWYSDYAILELCEVEIYGELIQ